MKYTIEILDDEESYDPTDVEPEYDLANMQVDVERTKRFRAYARSQMIETDPDIELDQARDMEDMA